MTASTNAPPPISTQTGLVLLRGGRLPEAEAVFRHLIAQDPANLQAYNGLAFTLKIGNRLDEAKTLLSGVCSKHPGEKSLWGTLGTVLMDMQDFNAAIRTLKKVITIDPALVAGLNNLALAYSKSDDLESALRQWRLAIKIHPAFLDAYLNLLSNLVQTGDHKQAADVALSAIRHLPNSPEIRLLASQAKTALSDDEQAAELAKGAAILSPAGKDVWLQISNLNPGNSTFPAYSIACDPNSARAHFNLGAALSAQKVWERSNSAYKKALETDPTLSEAKLGLASNYLTDRRFNGAIAMLQEYLKEVPDDPRALFLIASCYRNIGQLNDAKELFAQVLEHEPQHSGALLELSYIASSEGDDEQALDLALTASSIEPQSADVHIKLGHLYRKAKDYELSLQHYENSLVLSPTSAEALCYKYHIIRELDFLGRPQDVSEPWLQNMTPAVRTKHLDCPAGYGSLEEFNNAIIEYAKAHPSLDWEPDGKTTRNGRQTTPTLLAGQTGQVATALRNAILERLEDYLKEQSDDGYGFLSEIRPEEIRINLWCVFLEPGGHQLTHNHPAGWVSGVYYLKIPPSVTESAENDGSIEFGRPHDTFEHAAEHPTVTLKPEEGLMVMFPSSFFHRTFPYSEGQRICVAFDIVSRELEFHD